MLVICNGMPRSGSTLQYNLVRGIIEKMEKGSGEGFFNPQQTRDLYDQFEQWAEDNSFHVIKTQSIFPNIDQLLLSSNVSICYTYRDLRDVAASLERRFKTEGKELYKILDDIIKEYYIIQKLPNLISVQYEEMTSDTQSATRYMADALGLSPHSSQIQAVTDEFSLASAKKKIQKFEFRYKIEDASKKLLVKSGLDRLIGRASNIFGVGYTPPFFDPKTLMHAGHIAPENSSRSDYLSPEQIKYITEKYQPWLLACGYVSE